MPVVFAMLAALAVVLLLASLWISRRVLPARQPGHLPLWSGQVERLEGTEQRLSGRLIELDALRGLAALAVVLYHLTTVHARGTGFLGQPSLDIWWGDNGVEFFFVISGFVIFMTLENTKRPMDFVASRVSRLYPAYWAAILFTTAVVLLTGFEEFYRTPAEVALNFTMLQRLPGLDARDVDWSYWSLYTELLFYVAMLTLFVTGQLKRIELYLWTALVGALGFHGLSLVTADMSQASFAARAVGSLKEVVPYAPMFVVGICLYRLWQGTRPRAATALIVAAVLVAYATLLLEQAIALTIAIMAFALILSGRAGFLRTRPLIWLGGISYSLYLVHNVAGRAVIVRLQEAGWSADAAIAGAFATTLGAAVLINRGVEVPAQRWLRGVYRRRRFVQPSDFAAGAAAAEVRQN